MTITILVSAIFLTGCGQNFSGDASSNSSKSENTPDIGDTKPPAPGDESPSQPSDPAGPIIPKAKLCYNQNTATCYSLESIDDVNAAENMYDYLGPGQPGFPSGLDPVSYRDPIRLYFVPEVEGNTSVANNFVRREFIWANNRRGHYGYFSPNVVKQVQQLRERFARPLKINSGYRSPGYNATLRGAARFSRHTYGDAIDFKIAGVSFSAIANACRSLGAAYTQIYSSHVHCDWRTTPLNTDVFGVVTRPSSEVPHDHEHIADVIANHSKIIISEPKGPQVFAGNGKVLNFQVETIQEDAGELVHEWVIFHEGQEIFTSQSAKPRTMLKPGQYQVFARVGGNLELAEKIVID